MTVNRGGWDTHEKNFEALKNLLPELDTAFLTLLDDLQQRGLLDSTVVVWQGEFGRTPRSTGRRSGKEVDTTGPTPFPWPWRAEASKVADVLGSATRRGRPSRTDPAIPGT